MSANAVELTYCRFAICSISRRIGSAFGRSPEIEQMAKRQYVNSTAFADIHLGLGEKEKALDWLDVAYENQESACWLLKVDPIYDSVRNEPRFRALVQKVFGEAQ